ncbi:Stp1/IreP family PP2C-type Ser/Thr phosphatase [Clostridium sp. YIM B02505]|uniref:Stp1/IreP family PP2C-type Ser/Thr phosphatase n=1 Tax=Clostridium yunnanense TaxID=2800325 RepID=A0ABS1EMU7_9CLOT|nr:Stp1/IreP family PP2C-type Ser/Thr phosphatase [Clostridium yunnanense]MBK1810613.1 Stp1/IreP family PP2C-type Ser/Thr phosphatase [Clostridium yunnanense]
MVSIKTDVGNKRNLNEDFASYYKDDKYSIYVVTDGMGGHNAGEVASKMAAEGLISYFSENYGTIDDIDLLKTAIEHVNRSIFEFSLGDDALNGMGTTITACFVTKNLVQIANVGDSCCLGIIKDKIIKITKDHSLVQELVDCGSISEEEAMHHPRKNVITRAIGTNLNVEVDLFDITSSGFEILVLCSDGLTNEISNEEIKGLIKSKSNYDDACTALVELAKDRGGKDNITVMIFGGEI